MVINIEHFYTKEMIVEHCDKVAGILYNKYTKKLSLKNYKGYKSISKHLDKVLNIEGSLWDSHHFSFILLEAKFREDILDKSFTFQEAMKIEQFFKSYSELYKLTRYSLGLSLSMNVSEEYKQELKRYKEYYKELVSIMSRYGYELDWLYGA